MGRILFVGIALLAPSFVAPTPAYAASVTLSRATRPVTAAEIAAGAPGDGFVHDFFVTSSSDLLSIGRVEISAPLFQHTLGSDVSAPHASASLLSDALSADSFIALPSQTSTLGGFDATPGEHIWFDLANDGPKQEHHWARLTTMGQSGEFSGCVSVRTYDSFISLQFQFALPGTASDLAMIADERPLTFEYSLDPPPPPVMIAVPQPLNNEPPASDPPSSQPTFPIVAPEPQFPPPGMEPPSEPEYPTETPFELPYVDVVTETGDAVLETIVPPSIEPIIGEWIGSVETFPVLWTSDLQLWDGASLIAIDDPLEPFVVIDADGTTHWLRTSRFERFNAAGTSHALSLGNSLLALASTGAAAEAPIPEPATAALAFSGILTALAATRRRS